MGNFYKNSVTWICRELKILQNNEVSDSVAVAGSCQYEKCSIEILVFVEIFKLWSKNVINSQFSCTGCSDCKCILADLSALERFIHYTYIVR